MTRINLAPRRDRRMLSRSAGPLALILSIALLGAAAPAVAGPAGKPPVAGRSAPHKKAPTDEDRMVQAQAAYLRGERALAIDIAMQVAERGGNLGERAWRFIGLAACSVRAHRLATRAYASLGASDDRQMVVSACASNGLKLAGEQFVEN